MKLTILVATALMVTLALGSAASARRGVPVQNYENVPIVRADNAVLTIARVRQAIVRATQQNKWTIMEDTPGRIIATASIRNKHSLSVEVRYTGSSFSINYQGSSDLNYTQGPAGPVIHPAYNQQVKALLDSITAGLQGV